MAKLYISNEQETPRLFTNDLMEKLSHVHPVVPLILYVPVVIFFLFFSDDGVTAALPLSVLLFAGGALLWTLMEYVIHRWVFHYQPRTELGRRVHFLVHGVHHDYPRDPLRLVMPPAVSIPLAILFFALFSAIFGQVMSAPFFAGFVFGYICYDTIHYATHHLSLRSSRLGLWLKRYHLLHHYQDDDMGYGVSSPLWDYFFGTMPEKTSKEQKAERGSTEQNKKELLGVE